MRLFRTMRKVPLKLREFVGNAIRLKIQTSLDGQGASDQSQTQAQSGRGQATKHKPPKNKRSQEGGKRPNNNLQKDKRSQEGGKRLNNNQTQPGPERAPAGSRPLDIKLAAQLHSSSISTRSTSQWLANGQTSTFPAHFTL